MDAPTAGSVVVAPDEVETSNHHQADYQQAQVFITPAMQAFAEHWAINRNQIKAYQHAYPGSSVNAARTHAHRLFADGRIQSEIRRIIERWTQHSTVKLERLEHELSRIATADIRYLFSATGDLLDPHEWNADTAAAVASIKTSTTTAKNGDVTVHRTVRLHDKHAAARTLLEAKGAFQKNKPPPGVMAAFHFSFAGGQVPAGMPAGMTVDVDERRKLAKAPR